MVRLADDLFRQRGARSRVHRGAVPVSIGLIFVSIALLALSRLDHALVLGARRHLDQLAAPLLSLAAAPLTPLRQLATYSTDLDTLRRQLAEARAETEALKGWQAQARDLARQTRELERLARMVPPRDIQRVSARVIADATGPFARTVLVDAGQSHAVATGQPVVGAQGLVGRVLDTGDRVSRVLLLTDIKSRIPVLVGPTRQRALVVGDNSEVLKLAYHAPDARFIDGDEVVTSGAGGFVPIGLRIGIVRLVDGAPRVAPVEPVGGHAFVSILLVTNPARDLEPSRATLAQPETPPPLPTMRPRRPPAGVRP